MDKFQRLLLAIRRHPRWSWAGILAFAAAVTFPHENVQYLVGLIASRFTHQRVYQGSATIALLEGALLTFLVMRRLAGQAERRTLATFWILTLFLIWCTWRVFTANNVELVHYPQYVPEGIALVALTLSPGESLAWVALFGGLDECFQYWHLMSDKLVAFDFNDIYMDLLGGAAGVLLAMAFLRCEPRPPNTPSPRIISRPGVIAILGVTTTGLVLGALGLMQLYEDHAKPHHWFALSRGTAPAFWVVVRANGPHAYHTLTPIEGPILILATIALFGTLDRRLLISTPS